MADAPKWPWWIGWLFTFGFGLATALITAVLSLHFQQIGFWVGVSLMGVSVIGALHHLWRMRDPKWQEAQRKKDYDQRYGSLADRFKQRKEQAVLDATFREPDA